MHLLEQQGVQPSSTQQKCKMSIQSLDSPATDVTKTKAMKTAAMKMRMMGNLQVSSLGIWSMILGECLIFVLTETSRIRSQSERNASVQLLAITVSMTRI
jgi:hypothetical protein